MQAQRRTAANGEKQNRLLDELNAKFLQSLGGSGNDKRHSAAAQKLDSTQIEDGYFERIITGLRDGYVVKNNAGATTGASSSSLSTGGGGAGHPIRRRASPNRSCNSGSNSEVLNSAREIQRCSAAPTLIAEYGTKAK